MHFFVKSSLGDVSGLFFKTLDTFLFRQVSVDKDEKFWQKKLRLKLNLSVYFGETKTKQEQKK